jgi:L-iditol 2-dehydrogenase
LNRNEQSKREVTQAAAAPSMTTGKRLAHFIIQPGCRLSRKQKLPSARWRIALPVNFISNRDAMASDSVPEIMRAMVYRGVDDLRIETVPVPRIGSNELLVKVAACGVCPTDIKKIKFGTVPPPRIFGHETAGTIVRIGSLVRGFRVGERVALHHHVPCLKCHACRRRSFAQCLQYKKNGITAGFEPAGGGYAEYARVMRFVLPGVVKIPKRNTFEEGAMLEPVNTVLKAIRRLPLLRNDWVLVVGQGPIGLLFTRLLKLEGRKVLAADLLERRTRLAKKLGADQTFVGDNLQRAKQHLPKGVVLDAAIITAPSDNAVRSAHEIVRGGGAVLVFAHTKRDNKTPLDLSFVCVDEKDLLGSYSTDITIQREVSELVFSRRMDVRQLITHRFSLDGGPAAIELAAKPTERSLKIFIGMPS